MRPANLLVLPLALVASSVVWGWDNAFAPDGQMPPPSSLQDPTPWKEFAGVLPPWPVESALLEFRLDDREAGAFRYFIDQTQLTTGPDKVVRYTIVVQSASGARNVSYEGIRCTPRGEYKVYAYGSDGRFFPIEGASWQQVVGLSTEPYRKELWRYHFCIPREFAPRPVADMLRSLQGRLPPRQNADFQTD